MKGQLDVYHVKGYLPTIGIECHVQLKTKTKLFSGVSNDAREAEPNTLISHIDFGMPGALPVLNAQAIELAVRASFALNTSPQLFSKFDRKHYFYPDLPSGYQISQYDEPIILGGFVKITIENEEQTIGITRAHLEADAGKSTHPDGADYSLVDLNRAGTPLLEIVSEPDMHSSQQAKAYAEELYLAMKYADVSDVDLYHGNMRFDVNVSVSKDNTLGTRTETKNLNSFRSVEKAVDYEIARQIECLEAGQEIVQETRGWDDAKQKTFSQRSKEDAHDYRYFPDPDLPPIVLDEAYVSSIASSMPKLPKDFRSELEVLHLDSASLNTILMSPQKAQFVCNVVAATNSSHAERVANWLLNVTASGQEGEQVNDELVVSTEDATELSEMVEKNELSSTAAKDVWSAMLRGESGARKIAESRNLLQVSDTSQLEAIVETVLHDNEKAALDVAKGEMKAIGFLVGQVMKASQGKANPSVVQEIIRKKLGV